MNPLVSIIIPVYNGANYVAQAIESALAQTYENIEIVVVNDGSTDGGATEAALQPYLHQIGYFKQENGGVAAALNTAIEHAQGEYISWLSHDDLYTSDKIEKQINLIRTLPKNTVLYSDYGIFTHDPSKYATYFCWHVPPQAFRFALTMVRLHGCTLLVPRRAYKLTGMFNPALRTTQDFDMWFRMSEHFDFVHVPEVTVLARSHGDQGTLTMSETVARECDELIYGFIQNLSLDDITCAVGDVIVGYKKIAYSCATRGFKNSYRLACELGGFSLRYHMLLMSLVGKVPIMKNAIRKILVSLGLGGLVPHILRVLNFVRHKMLAPKASDQVYAELEKKSLQDKFTEVYRHNLFKGRKSKSGEGSDDVQTAVIRNAIPELINQYKVSSFLDAPCGDWYWMSKVNMGATNYIGADIVQEMIDKHNQNYANSNTSFQCINLVEGPLPKVDMIFSRDCLVHLSFEDSLKIIQNFKDSGAKYLLTTTFTARDNNVDLDSLFWRTLNLQKAPFNFPEPIALINENCTEGDGKFTDKCLGLWRLDDITVSR